MDEIELLRQLKRHRIHRDVNDHEEMALQLGASLEALYRFLLDHPLIMRVQTLVKER